MNKFQLAEMLADYHRECNELKDLGDNSNLKLKHAEKISGLFDYHNKLNNTKQLYDFCKWLNKALDMEFTLPQINYYVNEYLKIPYPNK